MINLAIIGTGGRAVAYAHPNLFRMRTDVQITALCDIDEPKMAKFRDKWFPGENQPRMYTDYQLLMQDPEIDGVIICSPDTLHKEMALCAFAHGKHVLLEKPIATTVEDSVAIYKARIAHPELAFRVGFTLRYAPVYARIKQLLEEKAIGQIVTIEAKEALHRMHGASFFRRWHRFRENNGGFMNAKCSHDMDLLTWLTGEEPLYMSAFGSRSYFVPKAEAATRCRDCKLFYNCKYVVETEPEVPTVKELWDACPFNIEGNIVDREVMAIEFTGGVMASFTVTMLSAEPASNRTICIHGSEGSLEANLAKGEILLRKTWPAVTIHYDVSQEASGGHGGGDPRLFCSFVDAIRTGENLDTGDARSGMFASVLAISSMDAMDERKVIDIQSLIR